MGWIFTTLPLIDLLILFAFGLLDSSAVYGGRPWRMGWRPEWWASGVGWLPRHFNPSDPVRSHPIPSDPVSSLRCGSLARGVVWLIRPIRSSIHPFIYPVQSIPSSYLSHLSHLSHSIHPFMSKWCYPSDWSIPWSIPWSIYWSIDQIDPSIDPFYPGQSIQFVSSNPSIYP